MYPSKKVYTVYNGVWGFVTLRYRMLETAH